MGIFKTLGDNVVDIGLMTVAIVLISILLGNFKTSEFICSGAQGWYNSTGDICCTGTTSGVTSCAGAVNQTAINSVGTGINTSITGVGTPITYIGIIILVLVFSAILVMLVKKLRNKV